MAKLKHERREEEGEKRGERIELSLGLSLNGKFGIDPKAKKLERCYSISNIGNPFPLVEKTGISWERVALPLSRTCSLPVEAEEESRKRKEIQMLRRREAKLRRAHKMGFPSHHPLSSQGSSASSSAFSDFDTLTPSSGMNRSAESKSPQSVQSFEQNEHRSSPTEKSSEVDNGAGATEVNPPTRSFSGAGEMVRNVLADMPSVFTRGDGPNGKRIEGFLYRYKKGEEVRIVCVCHGSFLTPVEFVKHAGGGDVEHPLRHIVVNSSSFL